MKARRKGKKEKKIHCFPEFDRSQDAKSKHRQVDYTNRRIQIAVTFRSITAFSIKKAVEVCLRALFK